MLVTLGVNQTIAASGSQTFTYSPNSVQEVHLALQDADWEASRVTVQIGSRTIVNGIQSYGLMGMTQLVSGTAQNTNNGHIRIDLGNWECTRMDNLYVTIQASSELTGIDISAIVDEPRTAQPLKWTAYSDNTFTSPNNLYAISYDSGGFADVSGDNYNIEIRNRMESSAPSLISANTYYQSLILSDAYNVQFGFLNKNVVPMQTTYNYSSSAVTDTIITCEAVGSTPQQRAQAKESKAMALASVGR